MSGYDSFVYSIFYMNMFALTTVASAGLFVGGRKLYRKGQEACSFLVGLRDSFNEANRNACNLNRTLTGVKDELNRLNHQADCMEMTVMDLIEVERTRIKYEVFRDAFSATYHLCDKFDVFNKLKDKYDDLVVVGKKIPQPLWKQYVPPQSYVCPRHALNRASAPLVNKQSTLTYLPKETITYEGDWYETDTNDSVLPEKNPWVLPKSTLPEKRSPNPSVSSDMDQPKDKLQIFKEIMMPFIKDKLMNVPLDSLPFNFDQLATKAANLTGLPVDINHLPELAKPFLSQLTQLAIKASKLSGLPINIDQLTHFAKPYLSQLMSNPIPQNNRDNISNSDEEPVSVTTDVSIKEWPQELLPEADLTSTTSVKNESSPLKSEVNEIKEISID